jgi:hypothetical protein
VAALFIVGFDVMTFLEKVKEKIEKHDNSINTSLNNDYKDKNVVVGDVIKIYDSLVKRDEKVNQIRTNINMNLWAGIVFLIACLIGAFFGGNSTVQGLSILIIFTAGFIFIFSFIFLIYYHVKN